MERKAHGGNLRKGRFSEAGRAYLVTTLIEARKPLFTDVGLGREVVHAMRCHDLAGNTETLAFVVMPDHLHWLFVLGDRLALATLVKSVKSYSSRSINLRLGDSGDVWQAGYHDHALGDNQE